MTSSVRLDDRNAWDDSALIDSWDEAVAEYKKYYSIQAQGKRLEDVLTADELKELKEEHGDLIGDLEIDTAVSDQKSNAEEQSAEESKTVQEDHVMAQPEESAPAVEQAQPNTATEGMPQALLGTVQDENLKNLMMSWYYAGYYTGLYTGQQKKA